MKSNRLLKNFILLRRQVKRKINGDCVIGVMKGICPIANFYTRTPTDNYIVLSHINKKFCRIHFNYWGRETSIVGFGFIFKPGARQIRMNYIDNQIKKLSHGKRNIHNSKIRISLCRNKQSYNQRS